MNYGLQSVIFLVVIFLLNLPAYAGELYVCIDKNGNETISSSIKDGMKCQLRETFKEPSLEEGDRKAYIERRNAITEREKAITEQEKARVYQEREKAQALSGKILNKECERECKMDRSNCETDCSRNTTLTYGNQRRRYNSDIRNSDRADCHMNCLDYQKSCIDRCYY